MNKASKVIFCILISLMIIACGSSNSEISDSSGNSYISSADTVDNFVSEPSPLQPKIIISRNEGELPFHIYVSASDTQMTGVSHPYDEVTYHWDFGNSDGTDIFTHPVTKKNVNPNSDQQGPEASYVYRYAGEYQITLTAQYQLEEETITERALITVHAKDWAGETRYVDPDFGLDENDGLTESSPWNSWAALTEWLADGNNRQVLIKRGTTMPVTQNITYSSSHIRIGSYGDGARPILSAQNEISNFIRLSPSNIMSDHVYSDLVFDGNNGQANSLIYAALINETEPVTLDHLAFINLMLINDDPHEVESVIVDGLVVEKDIISTSNLISLQNQYDGEISDVLVWGSQFNRQHSFKNGIYAEMKSYFSVLGSTFSGGDGSSLKDHPIYPAGINHALYRWIDFQSSYSNNFSINSAAKGGKVLRYTLVDGCNVTGGSNGVDFTKHNSNAVGWFGDLIIQNNAFFNLGTPNQGIAIYGGSLERAVIRDNIFYGNPQSDIFVNEEDKDPDNPESIEQNVDLVIEDNKFWKGSEFAGTLAILDLQNITALSISNNILVNEGETGGSTLIAQFLFPEAPQWNIDNNQYWAPDINKPFKRLNLPREYYDIYEWQSLGYDSISLNVNPMFINPKEGEF